VAKLARHTGLRLTPARIGQGSLAPPANCDLAARARLLREIENLALERKPHSPEDWYRFVELLREAARGEMGRSPGYIKKIDGPTKPQRG
jgi:hypothetical protein